MATFMRFDGKFQIVVHTTSLAAECICAASFKACIAMMASAKDLKLVLQCSLIALTAKSMPLSKILLYSDVDVMMFLMFLLIAVGLL